MRSFWVEGDCRAVARSSEGGSVHGQPCSECPKLHQMQLRPHATSHLFRCSNSFNRVHRQSMSHQAPLTKDLDPKPPRTGAKRLHTHLYKLTQQLL
jgi:hypothetical protein